MLMMRTVWFDTSGTGRLILVLLLVMMRTVWLDTSGTGRLMLALLVLLAFKAR